MIYSFLVAAIISALKLVSCSQLGGFVLIDTDQYPMGHVNSVIYAFYHFLPLRNLLFSAPLQSEDECGEDQSSVQSSLQLLFAKIYGGGSVNPVFLLRNSYLAAEGLEASPLRLPYFVDPSRFFSWSMTVPEIREMFSWQLEASSRFVDATTTHNEIETEAVSLDVDLGKASDMQSLQQYLDTLIQGTESTVIQQSQAGPKERRVIQQTRFIQIPRILTIRLVDSIANHATIMQSWKHSRSPLPISESLRINDESFDIYAVVCTVPETQKFVTFVRDSQSTNDWMQFQSDTAAVKVSFETVQRSSSNVYLLFYSQPESMSVTALTQPSTDLQMKSWAAEPLYQVRQTLLRSRSTTPTPPPSSSVNKSKRATHQFDFAINRRGTPSPAGGSPYSSLNGLPPLPSKQTPQTLEQKSFDITELLISSELKPVSISLIPADEEEDESSCLGESSSTRDAQLRADMNAFNRIAGVAQSSDDFVEILGNSKRADNYLYGWSEDSPPSLSLPAQHSDSDLFQRQRRTMEPLRRSSQSSQNLNSNYERK